MALGKMNRPNVRRTVHGWWEGPRYRNSTTYPTAAISRQWLQFVAWLDGHVVYDNNGELINMRTLTIELRFDSDEEGRHDALKDAAMQAAKHLFTQALLISNKRKPQIAMYTSDMFAGQQEIELAADLIDLGA